MMMWFVAPARQDMRLAVRCRALPMTVAAHNTQHAVRQPQRRDNVFAKISN